MSLSTIDQAIGEAFDALSEPATNPEGSGEAEGQPDLEVEIDDSDDDEGDLDDVLDLEIDDDEDGDDPEGESAEGDEPDEDDEDEDADATPQAVEVSEDDVIRLPDGTEVSVKDSALRQQDYTKKTQELSRRGEDLDARENEIVQAAGDLSNWYESRAKDPTGFAAEIVGSTGDPTLTVAKLLKSLAPKLDPKFVAAFGIDEGQVAEEADRADREERLERLEREQQEQREQVQASERQQQVVQHYLGKWNELKTSEGLEFGTPAEERERFREVVKFAAEKQVTDLSVAYAALDRQRGRQSQQTPATPPPSPAVQKQKRATRAMARRSQAASKSSRPAPTSTGEAADQAWEELFAGA